MQPHWILQLKPLIELNVNDWYEQLDITLRHSDNNLKMLEKLFFFCSNYWKSKLKKIFLNYLRIIAEEYFQAKTVKNCWLILSIVSI